MCYVGLVGKCKFITVKIIVVNLKKALKILIENLVYYTNFFVSNYILRY